MPINGYKFYTSFLVKILTSSHEIRYYFYYQLLDIYLYLFSVIEKIQKPNN